MNVLVAYATKYGATQGVAERIADRLRDAGLDARAEAAGAVRDVSAYDAFVLGSAAYIGHWQKDALEFARIFRETLVAHPTWLFSSGPLGTEPTNAQGIDRRVAAEPKDIAELRELVRPRDHRVFFGALAPDRLGLRDRLVRTVPAGRALLPEGDFRDWRDIDAWAAQIAAALSPASATAR